MRQGFGAVLGRVAVVIAGLLGVGIVVRLVIAILSPVLPPGLLDVLSGGWDMLVGIVSPALVPLAAVAILGALVWVVSKRS